MDDPALLERWNYSVNPPMNWQWMSQERPLDPLPTPPPPTGGLEVQLSTGPHGTSPHYCERC